MKSQKTIERIPLKMMICSIAFLLVFTNAYSQMNSKMNSNDTTSQKKGLAIEPKITTKAAFKVIGIEFCIDIKAADYKKMWDKFVSEKGKLKSISNGKGDYGLFHRVCDDGKTGYFLGTEVDSISHVPDGFKSLEIGQAQYAVFECTSETVGETWPYIHGVWLPNSKEYSMTNSPVFESYPPDYGSKTNKIFINIPVKKKE